VLTSRPAGHQAAVGVVVVRAARPPHRRDDGAMSDVHHCPFCELRFVNLAELNFHIQLDHPDRDVPEREY